MMYQIKILKIIHYKHEIMKNESEAKSFNLAEKAA